MLRALNSQCSQWDVRTLYISAGWGHTKSSLLPLCLLEALGEASATSGMGATLTWVLDLGVKQKQSWTQREKLREREGKVWGLREGWNKGWPEELEPSGFQVSSPEPYGCYRYQTSGYCLLEPIHTKTVPAIFPHDLLSFRCLSSVFARQRPDQQEQCETQPGSPLTTYQGLLEGTLLKASHRH